MASPVAIALERSAALSRTIKRVLLGLLEALRVRPAAAMTAASSTIAPHWLLLIRVLLYGVARTGADGRVFMPGYASRLSDAQIASLVNTLRARVGASGISGADVAAARKHGLRCVGIALSPAITRLSQRH